MIHHVGPNIIILKQFNLKIIIYKVEKHFNNKKFL